MYFPLVRGLIRNPARDNNGWAKSDTGGCAIHCSVNKNLESGLTDTAGQAGAFNPGAHGFSEILYAFSSAANNNGSAFGGIGANTPFYNFILGVVMQVGRFWPLIAILAAAGSLAQKKRIAPGLGTLPTHTMLFVVLLVGTVLLVSALTYVPALALGPIAEHFAMLGLH